jgi:hypothetical protein
MSTQLLPTAYHGKIFVITDNECFSSCALFLHKLKQLKNVIHIGQDAGKSTLFGDIRMAETPSRNIEFSIPQKVFFSAGKNFRHPDMYLQFDIAKEFQGIDSIKEQSLTLAGARVLKKTVNPGTSLRLNIKLAHDDKTEQKGKELIESFLAKYDLDRDIFTNDIIIEKMSIPHSHPVLTLNTRTIDDPNLYLATFVHEQIHWFFFSKRKEHR